MNSAIVTGASSGIGYEICKELLSLGYKVYGIGRDFSKHLINSDNFTALSLDMMNTNILYKKIDEIRKHDIISVLINNAGVGYFGLHEELNPKKIHEMVTINLEIPLVLCQILMRDIKKNEGHIINISSIEAKKSSTHGCAYGATKAGLSHFSSSLFDEARKYGVKVTAIHPDMTKTDFYRNSDFKESDCPGSFISPADIAKAVGLILKNGDSLVVTDLTLRPQKHMIQRKK